MRTLTWFLGMIVLAAWHSVFAELGHRTPEIWWAYLLSWIFLGAAVGVAHIVRWLAGKYKAGALGMRAGTPSSAPVDLKGEQ